MSILRKYAQNIRNYSAEIHKWLIMSIFIGVTGGLIGAVFHHCLGWAAGMRAQYPRLIWALPWLGCGITFLYHAFGMRTDRGTNRVLDSVRNNEHIPAKVGGLMFVSTIMTQLGGGSAGREGAALQIGGSIGSFFSHKLGVKMGLHPERQKIGVICGMAAVFSALFGTPIGATVFCIEVCEVAAIQHICLLPTLLSSVIAFLTAHLLGGESELLLLEVVTEVTPVLMLKTVILAFLCAMVSILLCASLHFGHKVYHKITRDGYEAVVIGGAVMIASYYLLGDTFLGAGMNIAVQAVEEGQAQWYTFLLKILFTATCLGAGFKGGEIVPSFAIGAAFGCVMGPMLGMDASLSAALGMIAVFCGVVNCPFASIFLSLELFGTSRYLMLFVIISAVSMLFSGSCSLYSSQRVLNNKMLLESEPVKK